MSACMSGTNPAYLPTCAVLSQHICLRAGPTQHICSPGAVLAANPPALPAFLRLSSLAGLAL
eukprot:2164072-Rhodomonas_salina.1